MVAVKTNFYVFGDFLVCSGSKDSRGCPLMSVHHGGNVCTVQGSPGHHACFFGAKIITADDRTLANEKTVFTAGTLLLLFSQNQTWWAVYRNIRFKVYKLHCHSPFHSYIYCLVLSLGWL